ncbi:alpha/beta hydrolase family protein [Alteromonas halophila]|uniref:Peptidase S9 n=1 Tax=Alteromonas halophila TaxID=516698 RepID=A0A918MZA1_9ALTE|nr:prolyl oligopeptidase family serine peptidase [Alteromonas halophila]GGW91342.1 peptidase S9 [Alteromonas halophila]
MKGLLALVTALGLLLPLTCQADTDTVATPQLPAELFSRLPEFERAVLSPNGERVAYVRNGNNPDAVSLLATFDLNTRESHYLVTSDNEKVKINWFHWANNDTLVISGRYESRDRATKYYSTRLFSMPFDGGDAVNLINWSRLSRRASHPNYVPQFQDQVIDWLVDDPDHILMAIDVEVPHMPSVYKVNIHNANASRLIRGKMQIRDWISDQQGNVRIGVSLDNKTGEREVLLLEEDGDWRTLFAFNIMTDKPVEPIGFGADPQILYYRAYKNDHQVLYRLNLKTNQSEEVLADPNYDVDGSLIYSPVTRDAIGVRHRGRHYWDDRYKSLQEGLDKALSDMDNYLVSFSDDENSYLLYSESDTTPGIYLYGNREKGKLDVLFQQYGGIPSDQLSPHQRITYTARDDVQIEAYLTLPSTGSAPYPTIIHPHGGPGVRDTRGFDYWTAYFTAQGFAVLRPNFRGSSGYGYSFSQSQMKQWGLGMQDDITDAAKWMVKEGYASSDNMCIVGASYGGYAALMATVKTPALFQCAVSFAGVGNLKDLVIRSRQFTNSTFVKNQIGDDYDDLEARSPYYHAEKVIAPILLIHGDEDRVVDVNQSRDMVDELDDYDKDVTYIELEAGDHYLSIQRNRHATFAAMDKFLKSHLSTQPRGGSAD